jgi:signal transduction histidine kinase
MLYAKHIEPGLLKVFRLVTGIEFALASLVVFLQGIDPEQSIEFINGFAFVFTGMLLAFLYWTPHQNWFLPLGLFIASVGPIIGTTAAAAIRLHGGETINPNSDSLLLWLLVPLLLVSSQYRMRTMIGFLLGLAALELLAAAWLHTALGGPALHFTVERTLIRLLIYGVVGPVVVRLTSAQRVQRQALAQQNIELAQYATTSEQLAISRERNRMARELHDTLAHTLTALSVQLQALDVLMDSDPAGARIMLGTIQDMTRQGVQEARRSLHALRASPLEDLGLIQALRQLADSTAEQAGITLTLDMPDHLQGVRPDIEQHCYRIAEEALTNVVRHANARTLTIRLWQQKGILNLHIKDDGVGFDPATVNDQHGLQGMRERVLLIGGELELESQPGNGTTLCLRL